MKNIIKSSLIISSLLAFSSIALAQNTPTIPAPQSLSPSDTNYRKCLGIAVLKRETKLGNAHRAFGVAVQPAADAVLGAYKAGMHFTGWLSWLNWFRPMSQSEKDTINQANEAYKEAQQKAQPVLDAASAANVSQFSTDQQYCQNHKDQTYQWTPADQAALDRLGYGNRNVVTSPVSSLSSANNKYSDSNPPSLPQPDSNTISLTINSPKTGDTWAQGYQQMISWTSSKPISQNNTIIYSYVDGPSQYESSYGTNGIGSTYSYKIGAPVMNLGKNFQPGSYRLKVVVLGSIQVASSTINSVVMKLVVLAQGISGQFNIVPASQSPTRYVSVSISGHGSIRSSESQINCPDPFTSSSPRGCTVAYLLNQNVTLTAIPSPGSTFSGWSADCTGTNTSCTVSVTAEKNVQAIFSEQSSAPTPAI